MNQLAAVSRVSALSICAFLMTGCAHPYVLKMQNGTRITTSTKPKLEHGYYVFKDSQGRPMQVLPGRIREIEPASMAEEEKDQFKISTPKK
jgi:hypothetical protein